MNTSQRLICSNIVHSNDFAKLERLKVITTQVCVWETMRNTMKRLELCITDFVNLFLVFFWVSLKFTIPSWWFVAIWSG